MTLPTRKSHHVLRSLGSKGFSIVEMLVATACLGILLGASFQVTNNALRREEGLAVVLAVAGWLEEIQRNAIRLNTSCTVTFEAKRRDPTPKNPGEPIASVTPADCAVEPILLLPQTGFSQSSPSPDRKPFQIWVEHGLDSWNGPELIFTKNGAVSLTRHYVFIVQSRIDKSKSTQRCVRITQVVGTIGVGKLREKDAFNQCIAETFDETI